MSLGVSNESKFWRVIAVLLIVGLFYVGHGMREGHSTPLPELTTTTIACDATSTRSTGNESHRIVTTNEDGTVIRVWHIRKGGNQAVFDGEFPARKKVTRIAHTAAVGWYYNSPHLESRLIM